MGLAYRGVLASHKESEPGRVLEVETVLAFHMELVLGRVWEEGRVMECQLELEGEMGLQVGWAWASDMALAMACTLHMLCKIT
jgi:hypothetical protein